jgi:hypothetical protein
MNLPPPLSFAGPVKKKKEQRRLVGKMMKPNGEEDKVDVGVSEDVDVAIFPTLLPATSLAGYVPSDEDNNYNNNYNNNADTTSALPPHAAVSGRPRSVQFPLKLHHILEYCRKVGLEDVMSWDTTGKSFQIYNKARFEDEVMPRFFDTNKFKSFQRSLNLWGFYIRNRGNKRVSNEGTNVTSQPNQEQGGVCYHRYFVRGRPDLCQRMLRIKKKTNKTRSNNQEDYKCSPVFDMVLEPNQEALPTILMDGNVTSGPPTASTVQSTVSSRCSNQMRALLIQPTCPGATLRPPAFSDCIKSPSMLSSTFPASSCLHSSIAINQALIGMLNKIINTQHGKVNAASMWNRNMLAPSLLCNESMLANLCYHRNNKEANARMLLNLASSSLSFPTEPSIVTTGVIPSWNAVASTIGGPGGLLLGGGTNNTNLNACSHSVLPLSQLLLEATRMNPNHRILFLERLAQLIGKVG